MPYILHAARAPLDTLVEELNERVLSVGELNYVISRLLDGYIGTQVRYATVNAAIGVLECAKLELYRRVAAGHEDTKLRENGEVYLHAVGGVRTVQWWEKD